MGINELLLTDDEIKLKYELEDKLMNNTATEVETNAYNHLASKTYRIGDILTTLSANPGRKPEDNLIMVQCFNNLTLDAQYKATLKPEEELTRAVDAISNNPNLNILGAITVEAYKDELKTRQLISGKTM